MSNGQKKKPDRKQARKERPVKGRTVYVGQRPKMPLIIAGIFVTGLLMLILAKMFSPKEQQEPATPGTPTNAVPAAATNAPTVPSQ